MMGEGNGMAQSENIDSGRSNFQLDDRSRRGHHSLTRFSKFTLSARPARRLTVYL